jgi:hypothetical protein
MPACGSGADTCDNIPDVNFRYRNYKTIMVASDWDQYLEFTFQMGAPTIASAMIDAVSAVQLAPCGSYVRTTLSNNARGTFQGLTHDSSGSQAIVFTTGPSTSPCNKIEAVRLGLGLDPGTFSGTVTFKMDLRGQVFTPGFPGVTPAGYRPDSTLFASDTISISIPTSIGSITFFDVDLCPIDLPNISAYSLPGATNLSLTIYAASENLLSLQRNSEVGVASAVTTSNGYSNVAFVANNFVWDPAERSMRFTFGRLF